MRLQALLLSVLTSLVALALCQNTDHGRIKRNIRSQRNVGVVEDDEDLNLDPTFNAGIFPVKSPVISEPTEKCGLNKLSVLDTEPASSTGNASFGEFPWMVALFLQRGKWVKSNYVGGGSLIHPSIVMTVAHKLERWKADQIKVRVGEWDIKDDNERYPYQERNVVDVVVHEDYFRRSLYNDIALLILDSPVDLQMAPHIGMGCLSPQPPPPGASCYSMGWGANDFSNKTIYASILKKIKFSVVEKSECEATLRERKFGRFFRLHPSLLCAGGQKNVDTCRGDGGAPLVCPIDVKGTRFAIFGMVAYGDRCGEEVPGIYVNVANLYEWIGRKLVELEMNTKFYTF